MTTHHGSRIVSPSPSFGGRLSVPGDKSISHRAVMLSAIAQGDSVLTGFLECEDCINTMNAVCALGARSFCPVDGGLVVQGTGGRMLPPAGVLDVGNSGTTLRLLAGLIAGHPITAELTGDASLRSRPMGRIKEPLERMGATVDLLGGGTCAPLRVRGGQLRGIDYELPVASAQVKSCVLLAALFAEGDTTVVEPSPTRDHTERLLRAAGVALTVDGNRIRLRGYGPAGPAMSKQDWQIPGDLSSAAFMIAGVAAREGAVIEICDVGLNPRRTAFLDVLQRMGARVTARLRSDAGQPEPFGDLRVEGDRLRGIEVGGDEIPMLIDELPLVAALGALAEGRTLIRDARELRVKESDRIATMAGNLALLGVEVEERADGMAVRGSSSLRPSGVLKSHGDHRIAMAMAVLGLYAAEPVCIQDTACIETSYPGFWADFQQLGAHVQE